MFVCIYIYGEGNGNPLQYSCLENPINRGAWEGYNLWGHSQTRLSEYLSICVYIYTWNIAKHLFNAYLFKDYHKPGTV